MKKLSTYNKSVLSIVIISAVTAAFISWDRYQPRHETASLVEFYQNANNFDDEGTLLQSLSSNDSDTLARIAEDNLVSKAGLIAAAIIEDSDPYESDEVVDYEMANEQVVLWQEDTAEAASNNEVVIASKVLFAFDSSEISEDNFNGLNETAKLMKSQSTDPDLIWQVVGYADRSGNYIYNSKLAKKRAQAVAKYLVNKGVNEDQLAVLSLGTSNPPNEERSLENNRNERRVEIHEYQAEVTALLEQYNKDLKQSQKGFVKPVEQFASEAIIVEVDQGDALIPTVSFKGKDVDSLTTAMEL